MKISKDRGIESVSGYIVDGLAANIKESGKPDLGFIWAPKPVNCAGVFTLNKVRAAPVRLCEKHLDIQKQCSGLIVNAGNANACTGEEGKTNALKMASLAAKSFACENEEILVCSTGIIGKQLPMQKVEKGILALADKIKAESKEKSLFSESILTTDLTIKQAFVEFEVEGTSYHVGGTCKGSGMIHPNMATMLAFVASDYPVAKEDLKDLLKYAVDRSFNCLSVDGDTSTNDSVVLFAPIPIKKESTIAPAFKEALLEVCRSLCEQIARDGEGAEHLLVIECDAADTYENAVKVCRQIANSPLVKTAVAGNDPNWGRILCAAGYSGVEVDEHLISIAINDILVFTKGAPVAFDPQILSEKMKDQDVIIKITLNLGSEQARFYSCDLTHGYITINAEYHT